MKTSATANGAVEPGRVYAEVGTVEHDGRTFSSGGAYVTDLRLTAYLGDITEPATRTGALITWDGTRIGTYVLRQSWPVPNTWTRGRAYDSLPRMYQVECRLTDGRTYQGRSQGPGKVVSAKRLARELKGRQPK